MSGRSVIQVPKPWMQTYCTHWHCLTYAVNLLLEVILLLALEQLQRSNWLLLSPLWHSWLKLLWNTYSRMQIIWFTLSVLPDMCKWTMGNLSYVQDSQRSHREKFRNYKPSPAIRSLTGAKEYSIPLLPSCPARKRETLQPKTLSIGYLLHQTMSQGNEFQFCCIAQPFLD